MSRSSARVAERLRLGLLLLGASSGALAQDGPRAIRLIDELGSANVLSPLLAVEAAESLTELGEVPGRELLRADFGGAEPEPAGLVLPRGASLERLSEGGHALRVSGAVRQGRLGWVLPAEPDTHYVLERSLRAEGPAIFDLALVEASEPANLSAAGVFSNHYMAGRGLALKIHYPPPASEAGVWSRGSASIFTTPKTRSLAIMVRQTKRSIDPAAGDQPVWFDDIVLTRVAPRPEQTLALMKARAPAPGADPRLGMAKYGQFPPLGEYEGRHSALDDRFSLRHVLYTPPPTRMMFELRVPESAHLSFGLALSRETPPGSIALLEVLAGRPGRQPELLWSRRLASDAGEWGWFEHSLDLGAWAGANLELHLRARAEAGQPHPVWSNPTLHVAPRGDGPRNVILLAVDTLRADRLSCYGYDKPTSPNIDALAADGVLFENVTSNANWTCPSFASIFTGLVPSRHGVYSYGPRTPLPASLETLAERFQTAGWHTYSIAYKPPLYEGGYDQGFNVSFNVPREEVQGADNLAEALEWLELNADRRNFLFLHFNDPHQPFTQPEPFRSAYGDPAAAGFELPYSIYQDGLPRTEAARQMMRALYDGEVLYVDHLIGQFLEALRARGLYEDAVIVFLSDHGEQLWEHGGFGHSGAPLYDEVVRVPLIVKAPGARPDTVVPLQVRGFDAMPTLLELAGLPVEAGLDAESLVPLLDGEPGGRDRLAVVESSDRMLALRNPRWKYLLRYGGRRGSVELLYDLVADPGETVDVAGEQPTQLAAMRLALCDYVLERRPGRYLAFVAGEPQALDVQLDAVQSAVTYVGLEARVSGGRLQLAGAAESGLVSLTRIECAGELADWCTAAGVEFGGSYTAGALERLLASGNSAVVAFEGPPPLVGPGAARSLDARQLEALRALGYGGDEDDE